MADHLGIDTSNYTTSVAVCNDEGKIIFCEKKLLPVKDGELGLRQSDAVFHHTVQLPMITEKVFSSVGGEYSSVGVSAFPRDEKGSYMPCFLAGVSVAKSIGGIFGLNVNTFSHQSGHIMAALYSSGSMDLAEKEFIAFHLSGGTTEALLVKPHKDKIFDISLVGRSLDLKAGQAVDRVGVMLGLHFPCGREVDILAKKSEKKFKIKPVMKNFDCCLSGVENKCRKMFDNGESKEDICRYCIDYIEASLRGMTEKLLEKYGSLPLVYAGGVMSNSLIKEHITSDFGGRFASPEFSSDNACGTALLSYFKENR